MKRLFTRSNIVALIIAFILGVIAFSISLKRNRSHFPNSFVMKYSEFGTPGSSDELLRSSEGSGQRPDDPSRRDELQIVVYRNVDLATVKRTYPELGEKSVYRYLEYSQALS